MAGIFPAIRSPARIFSDQIIFQPENSNELRSDRRSRSAVVQRAVEQKETLQKLWSNFTATFRNFTHRKYMKNVQKWCLGEGGGYPWSIKKWPLAPKWSQMVSRRWFGSDFGSQNGALWEPFGSRVGAMLQLFRDIFGVRNLNLFWIRFGCDFGRFWGLLKP